MGFSTSLHMLSVMMAALRLVATARSRRPRSSTGTTTASVAGSMACTKVVALSLCTHSGTSTGRARHETSAGMKGSRSRFCTQKQAFSMQFSAAAATSLRASPACTLTLGMRSTRLMPHMSGAARLRLDSSCSASTRVCHFSLGRIFSKKTGSTAFMAKGESAAHSAVAEVTATSRSVFSLGSPACSSTSGSSATTKGSNWRPKASATMGSTETAASRMAALFLSSSAASAGGGGGGGAR